MSDCLTTAGAREREYEERNCVVCADGHHGAVRSHDTQAALKDILERAMDHPAFSQEHFEGRFIEREKGDEREDRSLCEIGGEVCDWTMIAIIAADALNDTVKTGNKHE